jgi:hypothetical protein
LPSGDVRVLTLTPPGKRGVRRQEVDVRIPFVTHEYGVGFLEEDGEVRSVRPEIWRELVKFLPDGFDYQNDRAYITVVLEKSGVETHSIYRVEVDVYPHLTSFHGLLKELVEEFL